MVVAVVYGAVEEFLAEKKQLAPEQCLYLIAVGSAVMGVEKHLCRPGYLMKWSDLTARTVVAAAGISGHELLHSAVVDRVVMAE